MLVYLARHGRTKGNAGNKFHGRIETTLTRKGIGQAKKMAVALKGKGIARIYCSPMKRAMQTAKIIGEGLGLQPEASDYLKELDFGILDGLSKAEAKRRYPKIMRERSRDRFNFVVPKGESYAMVQKRTAKLLRKLLKKHKSKSILIVAHDCVNRATIGFLLKKEPVWVVGITQPHEYIYLVDTKKKTLHNIWIEDGSARKGFIS